MGTGIKHKGPDSAGIGGLNYTPADLLSNSGVMDAVYRACDMLQPRSFLRT